MSCKKNYTDAYMRRQGHISEQIEVIVGNPLLTGHVLSPVVPLEMSSGDSSRVII